MNSSRPIELPSHINLPREICGDLAAATQREWLVTNGLGGFASATSVGLLTRKYHGLLVAALDPPRRRMLLVAKVDEIVAIADQRYELGVNRWADGSISPQGNRYLDSLRLEGAIPVWTYSVPLPNSGEHAQLEKRVWMQHGANTTYLQYCLVRATTPLTLEIKVLVNYRDFGAFTRAGDWRMNLTKFDRGIRVVAFDSAVPFYLRSADSAAEIPQLDGALWYRNFDLAEEAARGYDHIDDHLHAATFRITLQPGATTSLVFSVDESASLDAAAALSSEQSRQRDLLGNSAKSTPNSAAITQPSLGQLVLATDAFVVHPAKAAQLQKEQSAPQIIAGYPWFGVWSRDTLVSLPGLTLATGRPELAREILRTFAKFLNAGMLPNFFPESGDEPEYNSVDAPLWFIESLRQYVEQTRDFVIVRDLFPAVAEIIDGYTAGTRFGIRVDPKDGLLYAGEPATSNSPATQLTWMDARVNGVPITPRVGKPIEINALWLNALITAASFARELGSSIAPAQSERKFQAAAAQARKSFARFWNSELSACFDVIDGPSGNDPSIRPNQIFAVSLPESGLSANQQRAIVDICARELLTPYGLRTLAPNDPAYCGRYEGAQSQRDAAYHQGTAWPWLLGPFITAHWKVYRDRAAAQRIIESAAAALNRAALGSISEICDADPPFTPRGCFAQAWSVAELLRASRAITDQPQK
jgi:predicted glycogen debranching enzyme